MSKTRLVRNERDKRIAGVCAGIADYVGLDVVLVRLAFALLIFATGTGLLLYFLLWMIMPAEADLADNWNDVVKNNLDEFGQELRDAGEQVRNRQIAGLFMVGLGIYLLLGQLGWMGLSGWWPFLLIALGAYLLWRRSHE